MSAEHSASPYDGDAKKPTQRKPKQSFKKEPMVVRVYDENSKVYSEVSYPSGPISDVIDDEIPF